MALLRATWQQLSDRENCTVDELCRTENAINKFGLHTRYLFMAVSPKEVIVPENFVPLKDLANDCMPSFVLLIVLEFIILRFIRGQWPHLGQILPNVYDGVTLQLFRFAFHAAEFFFYDWVYHQWHWKLADSVDWTSWPAWIALAIVLDLCYYGFHRTAHEMALFWSLHQVHHSSNFFNFSVAVRIPHLHDFVHSGAYYVPLALLGVPVHVTFVNKSLNLAYQFWTHTELVPKLPWPIEYIFNTPSHHRVHHARQPKYLDKNYGSVLIIWDRILGTYGEEEEQPIYGLTTPQNSTNGFYYQYIGFVELYNKVRSMPGWKNKLQCIIKGPGWEPGSPWTGYPEKVPEPQPALDTRPFMPLTWFWQVFLMFDLVFIMAFFGLILSRFDQIPHSLFYVAIAVMYGQCYCTAAVIEGHRLAAPIQIVKFSLLSLMAQRAWEIFGHFSPFERLVFNVAESIAFGLFIGACVQAFVTFADKLPKKHHADELKSE